METPRHSALKQVALTHLINCGHSAAAIEVRCPGSRYRADAAGYLDRVPWPAACDARGHATLWSTIPVRARTVKDRRCDARTVIIECKQSRSDFIREDKQADELIALRDEARRWKTHLEETRIKLHEPELRESMGALFADMESWDFARSRLPSYRKLLLRIRRIEDQLYGHTKFSLMSRYRLADQLFLMTPRGLIRPRELPIGWGLIEVDRGALRDPPVIESDGARIAVPAPHMNSPSKFRARLLRNIAVAATRASIAPRQAGGRDTQFVQASATPAAHAGRTSVPA